MGRTILAVLAGYCTIVALAVLTDPLLEAWLRFPRAAPPPMFWRITLGAELFYMVVGGFVCARIGTRRPAAAFWGLIVVGELAGILTTAAAWKAEPHGVAMALLIFFPPAAWLGNRLAGGSIAAASAG